MDRTQADIDAALAPYRPADPDEIVIRRDGPLDELGRCRFTAFWLGYRLDTGEPLGLRGQCFHANIGTHVAGLVAQRKRVHIVGAADLPTEG